jgi:diguanylate cyclase (GGDEF)-like protein/PAS domain S-box-containing protein
MTRALHPPTAPAIPDTALAAIVRHAPNGVALVEAGGEIAWVNPAFSQLTALAPAEAVGQPVDAVLARLAGGPAGPAALHEARQGQAGPNAQFAAAVGDGAWFELTVSALAEGGGEMLVLRDVTAARRNEQILTLQNRVLTLIAEGALLGPTLDRLLLGIEAMAPGMRASVLLLEGGRRIRHCSAPSLPQAYVDAIDGAEIGASVGSCGTAAYTGQQVITRDIATDPRWDGYRELALPHGMRACWSTPIFTSRREVLGTFAMYYDAPGEPTPEHQALIRFTTGVAAFAISRDSQQRQLEALAYHDPVTGLPNRSLLQLRLEEALAEARAGGPAGDGLHGGVLSLDLDHFKRINDIHGHDQGDALLRAVALRLQDVIGAGDLLARLGGDEFLLLAPRLGADADAARAALLALAQRVAAALSAPFDLGGHEHLLSASIGGSVFPKPLETAEDLLRETDIAMYQAKAAGRNAVAMFEPAMQHAVADRYALERELREGLRKGELRLVLQPQVNAVDGRICAAEALLRWRHPTRGIVPPGGFIPVAEDSGLVVPIGEWVLRESCRVLAACTAGGRPLRIAVNVSPRQFRQPDFVERVELILAETGADPSLLTLEITEGLLIDDVEACTATMGALAARGVEFSIDDFGTGFSSLSYLKRLPLHELKIDKSFVQDAPDDADDAALVEAILSIAGHFGLRVVAEGVETERQAAYMREHGCSVLQGFLCGRPMAAEELQARHLGPMMPGAAMPGPAGPHAPG